MPVSRLNLVQNFAALLTSRYPEQVRKFLSQPDPRRYQNDPLGYAREILKVEWWSKAREVVAKLLTPPHRVLVRSGNEVGKTHLCGGLTSWFYDSFDPGLCLTTAPTRDQVCDLLWKEVRVQRRKAGLGGFRGPKMPRLESSPDHWAHGFTARDASAFQGRHECKVMVIFDEAVGVAEEFWEAAWTMADYWVAIFNPTTASSQAYIEEREGGWHVVTMSCLDHPNIEAELKGDAPPFPAAISLHKLQERLDKWCTPITAEDRGPNDIEWPPGSDKWLRPGPVAEARLLARWPSQAINAVWSEAAWNASEGRKGSLVENIYPEIGCDVARFGDNMTAIHGRQGGTSFHHEERNGWSTSQTAGRLKGLCNELGKRFGVEPTRIKVKVDDDGVGGGVTDQAGGYSFIAVKAGAKALDEGGYPNKRSELWFALAEYAAAGRLNLGRLDKVYLAELRQQAMLPTYTLDNQGRRVVEPKDKTKERLKRSPDGMDAMNLAYAWVPTGGHERVAGRIG